MLIIVCSQAEPLLLPSLCNASLAKYSKRIPLASGRLHTSLQIFVIADAVWKYKAAGWQNKYETRPAHFVCICGKITALLAEFNFVIDIV